MKSITGAVIASLILGLSGSAMAEPGSKTGSAGSGAIKPQPSKELLTGKGAAPDIAAKVGTKPAPAALGSEWVATTWIVTDAQAKLIGPGADEATPLTYIHVLNLSDQPASPSVQFFSYLGTFDVETSVENSGRFGTIPSGGIKTLQLRAPTGTSTRTGWLIVQSDVPVILSAYESGVGFEIRSARQRTIPAHPLDCSKPQGFEYACAFLARSVTVD
jgi:hypothetical protein